MAAGIVRLLLTGDVMLGRGVDQILPRPSAPQIYESHLRDARDYVALAESVSGPVPRPVGYTYVWGDALDALRRAAPDLRIVNLETSITTSEAAWPLKGINYRMHPENVPVLQAAGVNACVLANNHTLDWGREGLVETLRTLRAAGIHTVGAGRDANEAWAPLVLETARGRLVMVAVATGDCGVPPGWAATADTPGIALIDDVDDLAADAILAQLARVERRAGDVAAVSIHWGSNWGWGVPHAHVRFAHRLVDGGVDVVYGHSSHHPRPIEVYRGRLILYGCGDLLNDYEGIGGYEAYRGDLALLYLPRFGRFGALERLELVPLRIRRLRLERPSAVDVAWLHETLDRVSRPFGTRLQRDGELLVVA